MHPGDQTVVDAFRALLAARKQPGPWQPGDDVAIEIGGHVARARTAPSRQPDTVGLVVVDPATGTPLIGGITADRTRILGTWSTAYAPLTHRGRRKTDARPRHQPRRLPAHCLPPHRIDGGHNEAPSHPKPGGTGPLCVSGLSLR